MPKGFTRERNALIHFIRRSHPEIYTTAIKLVYQKRLNDWSLVKPIYDELYEASENPVEEKHFFVAVIIEVFAPEWHSTGIKLPIGMRDVIGKAMGYINSEMVNYQTNYLKAYMKHPRFFKKMKETAGQIIEKYEKGE